MSDKIKRASEASKTQGKLGKYILENQRLEKELEEMKGKYSEALNALSNVKPDIVEWLENEIKEAEYHMEIGIYEKVINFIKNEDK